MRLKLLLLALIGIILSSTMPVYASTLASRLEGKILLQVEQHGEAWYVRDGVRYYMADGDVAYWLMRFYSLGISNSDLSLIPIVPDIESMRTATSVCGSNALASRVKGRILLQVEEHGEAWYVHPDTCRRIYMEDGGAAYSIMRYLSLGISDTDLSQIPILKSKPTDHSRGSITAKVALIEYCDFQSPFCVRFAKTLHQLLERYPDDIALYFRHFPLAGIHLNAQKAAEASECAAAQGAFWQMHDALYSLSEQGNLSVDAMMNAAVQLGLDSNEFNSCLNAGTYADRVQEDYERGLEDRVTGIPHTMLGAVIIPGAVPLEQIEAEVTKYLN